MTNYLDQIQIASPCTVSWESMTGNDTIRHCDSCSLDVYNISTMTKNEAEEFFAKSLPQGRVCARLYRRTDGTILTDDCPRGLRAARDAAKSMKTKVAVFTTFIVSCLSSSAQSTINDKQIAPPPIGSTRWSLPPAPHTTGIIALVDLGPYMANTERQINRVWFPPANYRAKVIIVTFRIDREGKMSALKLKHSCGILAADRAALKAIENADFRPLPPTGTSDPIEVTVSFDANGVHSFTPLLKK